MKLQRFIIIILAVLIVSIVALLKMRKVSKKNSSIIGVETKETNSSTIANWKYGTNNETKTEFATCISINSLQIGQGTTRFELVIRKVANNERHSTVFIILVNYTAGAFVTNKRNTEFVTFQFDNNNNEFKVEFVSPADVPGDIIYLRPYDKIVDKLRKSKILRVKAEFRNVGWKYIEFDVKNFKL